MMKYGFVIPLGGAREAANLASDAENSGWDGFFVCEPVWGIDAWVSLAAAAMSTNRIKLGTILSPISRMRPWKLASETVTLDHLSNGRLILSVGLGALETGFEPFGEVTDRKTRAELLDEGLAVLTGLWNGQPFSYEGKHFKINPTSFSPPPSPVQKPRIPIWVVGAWPRMKSMRRVLRYDGLLPNLVGKNGIVSNPKPADLSKMRDWIAKNREIGRSFDIIVEGSTPGEDLEKASRIVHGWEEAGATWWTETMWSATDQANGVKRVQDRIRQGPPKGR